MRPKSSDQSGTALEAVLVIILAILFVGAFIFGAWAFNQRQHYKNDSNQISATAAASAAAVQQTKDQQQFVQDSKKPYKSYKGPLATGGVSFQYPKTWSAYIDTTDDQNPIDGYFYPDVVPGLQSNTPYALRVVLTNDDYTQVLQQYSDLVTQNKVTAVAKLPPKMANVSTASPGTLLTGYIGDNLKGEMLIIKVRDKTLQVWTESQDFTDDFTNTVLKSLSFTP